MFDRYVLEQIQEPLLQLFTQIGEALRVCGSMDALMLSLLEMLRLCSRIFFSLNWQDLPEFFEDHMSEWMKEFNRSPSASCPYVLHFKLPNYQHLSLPPHRVAFLLQIP